MKEFRLLLVLIGIAAMIGGALFVKHGYLYWWVVGVAAFTAGVMGPDGDKK